MGIIAAYAVPHPPLIIPSVGQGEERGISDTVASYKQVAREIVDLDPDVIIISSPHAPYYRDAFHVTTDDVIRGDMGRFNQPGTWLEARVDGQVVDALHVQTDIAGIPFAQSTHRDGPMDHATFIPLYFVREAYEEKHGEDAFDDSMPYPIVRVGLSLLSAETHREFGKCIAKAVKECERRAVFIASGDLSHKLKTDGPYGYAAEGPEFDKRIAEIFKTSDFEGLFKFEYAFCEKAAECGLKSFQIMAGAIEDLHPVSHLLSYEGPFGVGYGVAKIDVQEDADASDEDDDDLFADADPCVALARLTVETYVRKGQRAHLPEGVPAELLNRQAGVFVSLHRHGDLRGCIGTISATCDNIAEEILQNGVSACSRDPRFPAVREDELDSLEYSVDVLGDAESISSFDELDPRRYGVIVTQGWKRGLLLPNLDGVDTVEQQVSIAKRKAGISVRDDNVSLQRFEVVRHTRGGEPREDTKR